MGSFNKPFLLTSQIFNHNYKFTITKVEDKTRVSIKVSPVNYKSSKLSFLIYNKTGVNTSLLVEAGGPKNGCFLGLSKFWRQCNIIIISGVHVFSNWSSINSSSILLKKCEIYAIKGCTQSMNKKHNFIWTEQKLLWQAKKCIFFTTIRTRLNECISYGNGIPKVRAHSSKFTKNQPC